MGLGLQKFFIYFIQPLPQTIDQKRNVGCLKIPVSGSGIWLSHSCGLTCWVFDLLAHDAYDNSSPEKMI